MKRMMVPMAALLVVSAGTVMAGTKVKVATVPAEYTPVASTFGQPVSLAKYYFEVNTETHRARLVVEYRYRDQGFYENEGSGDGVGPQTSLIQVPGLSYDARSSQVVYDAGGKRTVCAVGLGEGRNGVKMQNTGDCTVSTVAKAEAVDDGWALHHIKALEVWFTAD